MDLTIVNYSRGHVHHVASEHTGVHRVCPGVGPIPRPEPAAAFRGLVLANESIDTHSNPRFA